MKLHFPLLDESGLVDLILRLHHELSLKHVEHLVSGDVSSLVLSHEFFHHFGIDCHFVHALLQVLHVVSHALEIYVHCIADDGGHLLERVHDLLVVLHSFHIACNVLHLETHSLDVHG